MDVKELVNGFYYIYNSSEIIKYKTPFKKNLNIIDGLVTNISGIPLNDNLFLKVQPQLKPYFEKANKMGSTIYMYSEPGVDPGYWLHIDSAHGILVQYFHQLQNAIRILYNVEINVNKRIFIDSVSFSSKIYT